MTRAQVDAGRRYNGDRNKFVCDFILHSKLTKPMFRTETSLEIKLARKVRKRSKRDFPGLWEFFVPGNTVIRTSTTTTVIRERGDPEVTVTISDITKLRTKAERKRLPLSYDKTTEKKIAAHIQELKNKYRGDVKIRHREADYTSGCHLPGAIFLGQ